MILENTLWGKNNEKNLREVFNRLNIKDIALKYYNWGVSKAFSHEIVKSIIHEKSDCLFFVGNSKDAKTIFNSLGSNKIMLPIFSHWGISGGNNKEIAKVILQNNLNVSVIQTKFTFLEENLNKFQAEVLKYILAYNKLSSRQELSPMSGWVHSFDIVQLLLRSINGVDLNLSKNQRNAQVKNNLEKKSLRYNGLIKRYVNPFSEYSEKNSNAHEALTENDFIMRKYNKDGNLY